MSDQLLDFGATGGGGGGITHDVKWVESRYFIKVSDVIKPVGKDEPTISNIETYAKNNKLTNLIAYWNGTDDPNQGAISAYYIDKDGKVTQLDHPNTIDTNVLERYKSYNGDAHMDYRELAYVQSDSGVRGFLPSPSGGKTGTWCAIQFSGKGYILCNGLKITDGQVAMFILIDGTWRNLYPLQKTPMPLIYGQSITGDTNMLPRYVYSCSPSSTQTINMNLPTTGDTGQMVVIKNDGMGKVKVRIPPKNPFPELVIDELSPKMVSYIIYVNGSWQRITPLQFEDKTLKVVKYDSNEISIPANTYAICSGTAYAVDENAPDGTRWKIMNVRGSNSSLAFRVGGISVENILFMETLDVVKEGGNIHYSIKGKGLRAEAKTASYLIPLNSRVSLYHVTATQNIDAKVTLPSAWSTVGRYTIANVGYFKEYNVIVRDATKGKNHFIPENGSMTFESNKQGEWIPISSHLPIDQRLYNENPFRYGVPTRELFSCCYSIRGTGKYIYALDGVDPYHVDGYEGVEHRAIRFRRGDKRYGLSNIDMNGRSFVLSAWIKIDWSRDGLNSVYFLGNTTNSGQNQALHIGWRSNQKFTVAFYGNDVDFDLLSNHYADKIVGKYKWMHIAIQHNANKKKSTLWINGMNYGSKTHANGNYQNNLNLVFGARNTAKLAGFMSNFRLFVTASNNDINYNCARFYQLERYYFTGSIAD